MARVKEFFSDITHIAVDLNLKIVESPCNPLLKLAKQKRSVIEYLEKVAEGRGKIAEKLADEIKGTEITEKELSTLCKPFFRSSLIRAFLDTTVYEEEEIVPAIEDKIWLNLPRMDKTQ